MKITLSLLFLSMVFSGQAQKTLTIQRDSFSLKYPANWSIDTADEDYDPDALFSIDSPEGDNMIMFIIFDGEMDPEDLVKEQVKAFTSELIKKAEITEIDSWGNYKGKGKILKGKLMGVFKGFVKIFSWSDEHKSLLVVEQCFEKDFEKLKIDYELISSSFQFRK